MTSIPDTCGKCGGSDLDVETTRSNAEAGNRRVTITCNECGHTVADDEKVNYKSPVMKDPTEDN